MHATRGSGAGEGGKPCTSCRWSLNIGRVPEMARHMTAGLCCPPRRWPAPGCHAASRRQHPPSTRATGHGVLAREARGGRDDGRHRQVKQPLAWDSPDLMHGQWRAQMPVLPARNTRVAGLPSALPVYVGGSMDVSRQWLHHQRCKSMFPRDRKRVLLLRREGRVDHGCTVQSLMRF